VEKYDDYFTEACLRWGVPKTLALAIARHESGMNPWAVNVAGRAFIPSDKKTALRLIDVAKHWNKSFDVGLMQVNSQWLKKWGISPQEALDPRINIILGVRILGQAIERHGLSWKAVASYHTPQDERGKRYFMAVLRKIKQVH
jgi:soluble lytic murein transglycosylase-like protein